MLKVPVKLCCETAGICNIFKMLLAKKVQSPYIRLICNKLSNEHIFESRVAAENPSLVHPEAHKSPETSWKKDISGCSLVQHLTVFFFFGLHDSLSVQKPQM